MSGALRGFSLLANISSTIRSFIDFLSGKAQREAGAAAERSAVQAKTIEKLEEARKEKAQADEKVRSTPYDERVDKL